VKPEYKIQIKALFKLLWVVGFAFLYALGGIEHKEIRRFIAPIWLTSGMYLFSRDWRVFLQAPLLMATLSMGYGAEAFWVKVGRRLLFAFANAITAIVHIRIDFHGAGWNEVTLDRNFKILFNLNLILCAVVIITLGVLNPLQARAEELIIGFIIGLIPMFMPKDKDQ
jgi:hypothetical protein